MRAFTLKKSTRIKGLHFSPNSDRLLVLGGSEAHGIESAVCLDLASRAGGPAWTLSFLADQFAVAADYSRFVICRDAYSRADLPDLVRWRDPRDEQGGWTALSPGVGWQARTSAVIAGPLGLSGDGKRLVVGVGRQTMAGGVAWSFHLALCALDPPGPTTTVDVDAQVRALAVAPDGTRWATSEIEQRRGALALFDRLGGKPLTRLSVPRLRAGAMTFAPDGRRLAVVNGRGVILLDAGQLEIVAELGGHKGQVNALAFSPDGRQLLTASHDGAVRVWDGFTGHAVHAFDWNLGPVTAVAYAPDGLTCAAAGKKGQVVIWDV